LNNVTSNLDQEHLCMAREVTDRLCPTLPPEIFEGINRANPYLGPLQWREYRPPADKLASTQANRVWMKPKGVNRRLLKVVQNEEIEGEN